MSDFKRIVKSEISKSCIIYGDSLIRNSQIKDNTLIGDDAVIDRANLAEHVEIGRRSYVQDSSMGYGSYIGQNSLVKFTDIDKFCSISWNVSIGGSNHNYSSASMYTAYWWKRVFDVKFEDHNEGLKTNVGNSVWIGAGVNILRGITIGNGAVIGAGAVVVKDVKPFEIVGGVPAKHIKFRFDEETIIALEEIAWWNWSVENIKKYAHIIHADVTKQTLAQLKEIKELITLEQEEKSSETSKI